MPKATTPSEQSVGLYADAYVYDILHDTGSGKQSLAEAKLLVNIARKAGAGARARAGARGATHLRCYEPACGSGRVLVALAKLGHDATGSDLDASMVRYANARLKTFGLHAARGKGARAIVSAMEALPSGVQPGTIDLGINPINSIRHLGSDAAMLQHLRAMRTLLAPGGVYVVGISMSMVGHEQASEDVWKGSRDGVHVTQVVQFEPPTGAERGAWARRERVMSHLTIVRKQKGQHAGQSEEHRDSSYWLRTYSLSQWLGLVRRAKLVVRSVHSTDGVACEARELGYYWFAMGAG
jgi:SAM-dependent methyltransferase